MKKPGVLVFFVKTPEYSAVKTRLAAGIGAYNAQVFYYLSISALEQLAIEVKRHMPGLTTMWAVAEKEAVTAKIWANMPVIWQGAGTLGDRFGFVYERLIEKYKFVCFMGPDSPHISSRKILTAIEETAHNFESRFVLGPTIEGGFYFYGGSLQLKEKVFEMVNYSRSATVDSLKSYLESAAPVKIINLDFDIDTVEDLSRYVNLKDEEQLLKSQINLIEWVRQLTGSHD